MKDSHPIPLSPRVKDEAHSSGVTDGTHSSTVTEEAQSSGLTDEAQSSENAQSSDVTDKAQSSDGAQSSGVANEAQSTDVTNQVQTRDKAQSSSVTDEAKSIGITDEMQSSAVTDKAQSSDVTDKIQSNDKAQSIGVTDKIQSTDKAQSSGVTDNAQSSGVTDKIQSNDKAQSSGVTDKAQPSGVTDKTQSSGVTDNAQSSGVTDKAQSSGVTDEAKSSGVTDESKSTSGVTDKAQSSGVTDEIQSSAHFSGVIDEEKFSGVVDGKQSSDVTEFSGVSDNAKSNEKENNKVDQSGDCKGDFHQSLDIKSKHVHKTSEESDKDEDSSQDVSRKVDSDMTDTAKGHHAERKVAETNRNLEKSEVAKELHEGSNSNDDPPVDTQFMSEKSEQPAEEGCQDSEVETETLVLSDISLAPDDSQDNDSDSPGPRDDCSQPEYRAVETEVSSTIEPACGVTSTDQNNNRCTSRTESVVTPDNDRGISPEIFNFCMSHMSPTELYGKDHMIGVPRLLTRPRSSLSRSGSTLNTPDPMYIDNEDLEDIAYFHSKGVKRRMAELDENENPVPYYQTYQSLYQPNRVFPSQPSGPDQSSLYSGHREAKSHAACRLDFGSPADTSRPEDYTSPVNAGSFYTGSQQYTSQVLPSFVSSHSFIPQTVTRPTPVVPVMTSYPSYGYPQLDVNCNPCSPVPFSTFNYDTVFRSPFAPLYPQAPSCSSYTPLGVPQINHQSPYTGVSQQPYVNTPQMYPNVTAYRENSTSAVLNRTDQCAGGNLNFTEIYRSTCPTNRGMNTNPALYTRSSYCRASRPGGIQGQNSAVDLINNNLYGERHIHTTKDVHRGAVATVTQETSNEMTKKGMLAGCTAKIAQKIDMTSREGGDVRKKAKLAEEELVGEDSDTMSCDSDSASYWKNRNATLPVPLKAKDKKIYVSVSDLGGKTVKQLLTEVKETESDSDSRASTPVQPSKVVYNEAFIAKFKEERKTKSPLSAFCAALDEPRRQPERPILAAEPRIPIPALLMPNEVPMMYNGQMLVPYFQQQQSITSANTGSAVLPVCAAQAMVPPTAHIPTEPVNQPPSFYTETTRLGLLGSYTLTNKTSVAMGSQLTATPLNLAASGQGSQLQSVPLNLAATGQVQQVSPYASTQYPFTAQPPVTGPVPIAPHTEPASLGRRIAPAISQPPVPAYPATSQPALPAYPATLGQLPLAQPIVATPLYEKLPDPYLSATAPQSAPAAGQPKSFLSNPASASETRSSGAGIYAGVLAEKTQPGSSSTSASKLQGSRRASTPGGKSGHNSAKCPTVPRLSSSRCWKAKHYNFTMLRIGTFKYTCDLNCTDRTARLKVLFRKRKLVYEYQVDSTDASLEKKTMAEIVVPFNTIVSLWLSQRDMHLEVSSAPMMYGGVRGLERNQGGVHQATTYNRKEQLDLTSGQLNTCPYHKFKTTCTAKLREDFEEFDPRFRDMMMRQFTQEPGKTLRNRTLDRSPVSSYLINPDVPPVPKALIDLTGKTCAIPDSSTSEDPQCEPRLRSQCDCIEGCDSTSQCPCCALGARCTQAGCTCLGCQNPLNILHNIGLPSDRAQQDPCLMDNIYQISHLDEYVKTPLSLDCCQCSTVLYSCIPGEVPCPNLSCATRYKYSWCAARLCNEALSPRNHCEKCRRCTDYRDLHCETCNVCYFAGEHGSFKCAACHSLDEMFDSSSESG